ncbi:methylglyoxal synthase [Balneolales bacterium ANBcel1]|nr:methylglyoxal synthase [Balneolales bacterium ANBcel1]
MGTEKSTPDTPNVKPRLQSSIMMAKRKRIVLIAHDNRKAQMLEWARWNKKLLGRHQLFGTGTTGGIISKELGLDVHLFKSGPLGGDQQVGSRISDGEIDLMIFFWDPMSAQPHDVDVKALLRLAVVYNIPVANNRSSADFMISSPLLQEEYERKIDDYAAVLIDP